MSTRDMFGGTDSGDKTEKITKAGFMALLNRQSFKCALSGRDLTPENCRVDHIMPVSRGGGNIMSNLQLLTAEANKAKHNLTDGEFIALCVDVVRHAIVNGRIESSAITASRSVA